MARSKPKAGDGGDAKSGTAGWARLSWDDLNDWAGSRSVQRGRSYQRGGRVRHLAIAADGELLATVIGTEPYATSVRLGLKGKKPSLESDCSCPIGGGCKHAVAVVADYLQALADGRAVPTATDDDPRRLASLTSPDKDGWDGEDWDDEDEEAGASRVRIIRRGLLPPSAPPGKGDWDAMIEREIRSMTHQELADLAWSLVRQVPKVHAEFRERLSLRDGNAARLLAETRREVRDATAPRDWEYDRWGDGGGESVDYGKIRDRLERLVDLGMADEVVALGRTFFDRAMTQIEQSEEVEGTEEVAEVMGVVFGAVMRSSLSGPERLLYAIEVELADDFDTLGDSTDPVFDGVVDPADWSAVADALRPRLDGSEPGSEDLRDYARDQLSGWIADALRAAGREGEIRALFESEARKTRGYVRLVDHLIASKQVEAAEAWAREGIEATSRQWPGIADELARRLRDLDGRRKRWDVVAAHVARPFFDYPTAGRFEELMAAARKAKLEKPVRAAALRFLETGEPPYRLVAAPAPPPPAKRRRSATKNPAPSDATARPTVEVDPGWPLPIPEDLIPLLERSSGHDRVSTPHLDVLLEMALAAKRPDEILRWFDAMADGQKTVRYGFGGGALADRVAAAVAATHPERAIAAYRVGLDAHLPHANPTDYEAAVGYLKKLRPIYEGLGRRQEWDDLVAAIREKYRNRPRFLELLDPLVGRTILDGAKPRKR